MATIIKLGGAALLVAGLGACAPVAYNFGEATAYNKVAQVIDPTPEYEEDDAQPGDNGERAADSVERYREGGVGVGGQRGGQGGQGGGGRGGSMGGLGAATGPR